MILDMLQYGDMLTCCNCYLLLAQKLPKSKVYYDIVICYYYIVMCYCNNLTGYCDTVICYYNCVIHCCVICCLKVRIIIRWSDW